MAKKRKGSRRELIEPSNKRYVRRGKKGRFTEKQVDVGRSLAADRRSKANARSSQGKATGATLPLKRSRPKSQRQYVRDASAIRIAKALPGAKAATMPTFIAPCLATLADRIPAPEGAAKMPDVFT
jgi:hypothetical protein